MSVIENPAPSKGSYGDWLGENKPPTWKGILKQKIDEVLPGCSSFEDFLLMMKNAGYAVKDNRKYISFTAPGQKKPTRMKSLGDEYTEAAVRARLGKVRIISGGGDNGQRIATSSPRVAGAEKPPSLLIDIQEKIREGKGSGVLRYRGCKSYTLYIYRRHKRLRHTNGL